MSRIRVPRAFAAMFLTAGLATMVAAAPASASGTTRWVDDDGHAGPSSCSGTGTAHKTIQKAVLASGANDTVNVCAGTYVEKVNISGARNGLTLQAVTNLAPVIKAPADATFNTIVLVRVTDVPNVTVKGFSIRPLRANSHDSCDVGDGIKVTGSTNVSIKNNEIKPSGSGPFCGVFTGVSVTAGTTGTISSNKITDYIDTGILVSGATTNVKVSANTITFAQVGLDTAGGAAVRFDTGAKGSASGNAINGPAAGPGNPPQPAAGVELDGSGSGVTVSGNTIARMAADIRLVNAAGGSVTGNTTSGGQTSFDIQTATNVEIANNVAADATFYGFFVANASTHINVHDNDFRTDANGAHIADCKGESNVVISAGSANTFDNNLGNSSNPAVLCDGRPPR